MKPGLIREFCAIRGQNRRVVHLSPVCSSFRKKIADSRYRSLKDFSPLIAPEFSHGVARG